MPKEICTVCPRPILVTIFRGSGLCSENCRKKKQGDAHFNKEMSSAETRDAD